MGILIAIEIVITVVFEILFIFLVLEILEGKK